MPAPTVTWGVVLQPPKAHPLRSAVGSYVSGLQLITVPGKPCTGGIDWDTHKWSDREPLPSTSALLLARLWSSTNLGCETLSPCLGSALSRKFFSPLYKSIFGEHFKHSRTSPNLRRKDTPKAETGSPVSNLSLPHPNSRQSEPPPARAGAARAGAGHPGNPRLYLAHSEAGGLGESSQVRALHGAEGFSEAWPLRPGLNHDFHGPPSI